MLTPRTALQNKPPYQLVMKYWGLKQTNVFNKGLQRQRLIGSAVAGFKHAKTITKASATDLHARQDDYNKGN